MGKTFKHEASGTELLKEIVNPDAIEFYDVFEIATKSDDPNAPKARIWQQEEKVPVGPSCYFHMQGRRSLRVKCKDWVMDEIEKNMLNMKNDSLYFEIVSHDNGWSLVIVKYNIILGDRWLAYIKTDSIPL